MLRVLYAQFFIIHTGPYVILAVLGIVAFWRDRSIGTALFALGFVAYVVGQVAGSFVSADVSKTYNSHGEVTSVVESFSGWAWTLSRYAGLVGMWVAAAGAAMHVLRIRRAPGAF
jgi:uncharacterized membrane protein AbrB (regulator of aidB expression)